MPFDSVLAEEVEQGEASLDSLCMEGEAPRLTPDKVAPSLSRSIVTAISQFA